MQRGTGSSIWPAKLASPNLYIILRYYAGLGLLYAATLLSAIAIFKPHLIFKPSPLPAANQATGAQHKTDVIYGRPVRIVIQAVSIDLPVDEGFYYPSSNTWTLSNTHAQFAMVSSLANNDSGNTFIYGHESRAVFVPLQAITPGAEALLYTDNGHIFSYIYQRFTNLRPSDTSILRYKGPPILTVQTCSGNLLEWRQMFTFNFNRVIQ
jgi:sortase (surface protein transpeptidase)